MDASIERLVLGTFVRPGTETPTGEARVEVACAYLVRHPDLTVLFDTGIGVVDEETERHYRPSRVGLDDALAGVGAERDDVDVVVNCHLHFDHCGGNPSFVGKRVVVQESELATARAPGYTVSDLVDFPGASYDVISGEHELASGLVLIPTPGHTAGHQSLAVSTQEGWQVLAGQAVEHASDFTALMLAAQGRGSGEAAAVPDVPAWVHAVRMLDPVRVWFAQDLAVWQRG